MTIPFRLDIQALRGVAIIAVFCFHLFPAALPAGFLGVDLFFVLSGFLMGSLYEPTTRDQIRDYLLSRARRILPAYAAVLLGVVLAATAFVLPHELDDVIRHAAFAAALVPNIGYWLDGSYFDKSAFRPALHLWSLGVEIQFYLVFPLIVLALKRWPRVLAAVAVSSFIACLVVVGIRPRYAFYLLPFRLWEFLIGFYAFKATQVVALSVPRHVSGAAATGLLAAIGLIMVFPIEEISHPKFQAAFIALATAAILVVGLPNGLVASAVGRALVLAGTYSYSVYLVHFPVIVFWFYRPFGAGGAVRAGAWDAAVVCTMTLALSVLLFHAIEAPLRRISRTRTALAVHVGSLVVVLTGLTVAGSLQRVFVSPDVRRITDAWHDRGPDRCGKFAMLQVSVRNSCALNTLGDAGGRTFLLVGDSHANAIKEAMAEVATQHRVGLRFLKENCVLGVGACSVDNVAASVADQRLGGVILHTAPGAMRLDAVEALIRIARTRGFAVVILDPVPVWIGSIPRALYEIWTGGAPADWLSRTIADYQTANADYLARADEITGPNVTRYGTADLLCRPKCAYVSSDGRAYYFDGGHLTITGARQLDPVFQAIFRSN